MSDLERYKEALEYYNKALDLKPEDINALYEKIYVLNEL